jgi:hypothetical protein
VPKAQPHYIFVASQGLTVSLDLLLGINTPLLASQTAVVVVTPLGVLLGGSEQLGIW